MKTLILERFCYSPQGTFGRLFFEDLSGPQGSEAVHFKFYTVEQPWNYNKPFHSCIPEGEYVCKRWNSQDHPNTWEVTNVPNRTEILFHVGNNIDDVVGCIALGYDLGWVQSKKGTVPRWSVTGSLLAVAQFREYLKNEQEFRLEVTHFEISR